MKDRHTHLHPFPASQGRFKGWSRAGYTERQPKTCTEGRRGEYSTLGERTRSSSPRDWFVFSIVSQRLVRGSIVSQGLVRGSIVAQPLVRGSIVSQRFVPTEPIAVKRYEFEPKAGERPQTGPGPGTPGPSGIASRTAPGPRVRINRKRGPTRNHGTNFPPSMLVWFLVLPRCWVGCWFESHPPLSSGARSPLCVRAIR